MCMGASCGQWTPASSLSIALSSIAGRARARMHDLTVKLHAQTSCKGARVRPHTYHPIARPHAFVINPQHMYRTQVCGVGHDQHRRRAHLLPSIQLDGRGRELHERGIRQVCACVTQGDGGR